MTVSVIIPNYNHARFLPRRIESVLNQTYRDFELIILDDFSTDNSRSVIQHYASLYPQIITFFNQVNSGSPFAQWNLGVSMSKGEFIWIAESDDFAELDFLQRSLDAMNKNVSVGLVYCNSKVYDEKNKGEYLLSSKKHFFGSTIWLQDHFVNGAEELKRHLFLANTINNVSAVLFRRNKYAEAGFADQSMKFCGDWHLYVRVLMISDLFYLASPLNNFRIHSGSSFNRYFESFGYLAEVMQVHALIKRSLRLSFKKKILILLYQLKIYLRQNIRI